MLGQLVPVPGRAITAPPQVPTGTVPDAAGPALAQQNAVRQAVQGAFAMGQIVGANRLDGRPGRVTFADVGQPQHMPDRPRITVQMGDAVYPLEVAWASLPGRRNGISWDGEPGAHAPH